ncbi:13485_t:CDS:2, partial [Acaulospora morrowiae]
IGEENHRNIEKLVKGHINIIEYNKISVGNYITDGGTYRVQKAVWNSKGSSVVTILKHIKEKSDETKHSAIIRELKIYHSVNAKNDHENYTFFTIHSFDVSDRFSRSPDGSYIIILEYANLGDLHNYLTNNHSTITWREKIDIGKQELCFEREKSVVTIIPMNHLFSNSHMM